MRSTVFVKDIPIHVRRAASAFHEAGHIVVGWVLKRKMSHAWLRPPEGLSGETCFVGEGRQLDSRRPEDLMFVEDEMRILCAGYCGELIYWSEGEGLQWNPGSSNSHREDLEMMEPLIDFVRPANRFDYREHCAKTASQILFNPQMKSAMFEIAEVLISKRRIEWDEIDSIMRRQTASPSPEEEAE